MKKSDRKLLSATLDKALEPPTPRRKPALATNLAEYDDAEETTTAEVAPRHVGSRGVTPPDPTLPTSPARDFNKRANSLDKLALPAGIFPGSSKKLYDALYVRTRGAVKPQRTVRATKRELSEWSGVRNVKTIDSHLRYFSAVGLVVSEWQRGQNDGCLYEVMLPEETSGLFVGRSRGVTPPDPTSPGVTPPDVETRQNSGSPHHQNSGSPHPTQAGEDSTVYEERKTSFKTKDQINDDEPTAFAELRQAERELTGKNSSSGNWSELDKVLAAELRIAAGRTTVSSVPAFLAEHLRRRLWKLDKKQAQAEGRELPDQTPAAAQNSPQECPDCKGTGWWYPNGQEKGVAKCRHEKLSGTSEST
jgi:hypothetical protein